MIRKNVDIITRCRPIRAERLAEIIKNTNYLHYSGASATTSYRLMLKVIAEPTVGKLNLLPSMYALQLIE